MYLHSNYKVLNDLKKHKSTELELILIEIMNKEKKILLLGASMNVLECQPKDLIINSFLIS